MSNAQPRVLARVGKGRAGAHNGYSSDSAEDDEPMSPLAFTRASSGVRISGIKSDVKRAVQAMRKLSDKRRRSSGEGCATAGGVEGEGRSRSILDYRALMAVILCAWLLLFALVATARARAASNQHASTADPSTSDGPETSNGDL